MRQKESKLCWPFKLEKDTSEVPKDMLPPLDVPKFRWWRCQTCVPDLCMESTPAENVVDNSGFKCNCESARTNLLSQSQTATVASDFRQIMSVGIASTGKSDATVLPQNNGNDVRASLDSNAKKDKEDQTCTLISKGKFSYICESFRSESSIFLDDNYGTIIQVRNSQYCCDSFCRSWRQPGKGEGCR